MSSIYSLKHKYETDSVESVWMREGLKGHVGKERFAKFFDIGTMFCEFIVASVCSDQARCAFSERAHFSGSLYMLPLMICINNLSVILKDMYDETRADVCYQVCEIIRMTEDDSK